MIKGTDLAYCNPNTNYLAMRDAGIRFAILKLGQGLLPKDIMFDTHRTGCETVGVPWDLYWFSDYRITALQNVNRLVALANGDYGMKHVCKDLEYYPPWGYPSGKNMLTWCQNFSEAFFGQTGMKEVLYTNRWLLNVMWGAATDTQKEELATHELWFATDTVNPNPTHLPIKINQFELDFTVPWCVQKVDLNDFWGTEEEFIAWTQGVPPPLTLEQRVLRIEEILRAHDWLDP